MFGLANDGKTNGKGLPNPFRLAVIANHHFDDVRLPFPPAWVQKLGLVEALRPVGCSATRRRTRRARSARWQSSSPAPADVRLTPEINGPGQAEAWPGLPA